MNQKALIATIALTLVGTVVSAGVTTEKDIGACTKRNPKGYCIESKSHTCFDVNPMTGQCRGWTIKNGDQFKDIMRQFNSYNQDLVKGVKEQGKPAQRAKIEAERKAKIAAELKKETAMKEAVPNSLAILKAIDDTRIETSKLAAKQDAGVDVSEEMSVLDYKYQKLFELQSVSSEFENAYDALISKTITQAEYNEIITKIKKQDYDLKQPLEEIMNATAESLKQAIEEANAKAMAQEKKKRKIEIGRKLLNQGTLYMPPSTSNWIRQGADALELLK